MDEAAVADIFAAFGPVRCRRMFGGLGLYADGLMFAIAVDDTIYLKTDAGFAAQLEAEGARIFAYERQGRRVTLGFWSLPEPALDDADAAAELARRALGVARAAAVTPPRRTPARSRARR